MNLSLFVVSHDQGLLDQLPERNFINPIHLDRLDIEDKFKGQSLSENRIFLSDEVLDVNSEFIGLVSARYDARIRPGMPKLHELQQTTSQMTLNELFAPNCQRIANSSARSLWIKKQDGEHPGISNVLRRLDTQSNFQGLDTAGYAVLGNQFIVHRDVWVDLVQYWRQLFLDSYELWGLDAPFSHRCYNCGANRPNGYERYGPQRQAGFLGERITALFFAQKNLVINSNCLPDPPVDNKFLNLFPDKILGYMWQLSKYQKRAKCQVCNPQDK